MSTISPMLLECAFIYFIGLIDSLMSQKCTHLGKTEHAPSQKYKPKDPTTTKKLPRAWQPPEPYGWEQSQVFKDLQQLEGGSSIDLGGDAVPGVRYYTKEVHFLSPDK